MVGPHGLTPLAPDTDAEPSSGVWRPVLLTGVTAFLVLSAAVIPPDSLSNPAWHLAVEVGSVTLAAILGALALVRFYARRQRLFVFIGTGFLATAVLDGVHAFVASDLLGGSGVMVTPDVSAWTWLQARVFLSLFLAVSVFAAEPRVPTEREGSESRVFLLALTLALAVLVVFGLVPTPRAIDPARILPRPWELVPAALFALAAAGYLRRGRWRFDAFEYWLIVGLLVACIGHGGFMARSVALYDPFYDAGHLLKLASYLAVACGLLVSIHETFRREAAALVEGADANRALAREVEVRREAESVLQRSEERLQGFLESAHDLIQSTDAQGCIVYVNRAWEHTLGYDRAEVEGRALSEFLHPRCRAKVFRQFLQVMEGRAVDEILAEFVARDGRIVVCSGRATRHVADDRPDEAQAIFRDVTAEHAAERELAASRANVRALVENTGDLIWSVNPQHRLVTFNSAFALAMEARFGREPRVGDGPDDVFGPEAAEWYEKLYTRVLRGQRFSALRQESVLGQVQAFEIFCNPVHEGAGATGAVMFGRDVTGRLQADEALRLAKEEAEAANRAKSQFLANMSHELRTPLNSVIGFANILLKNKAGTLQSKELGFLERILANGRHLLSLINEVLDLAKIEAGRMDLDLGAVDLAAFVTETVSQLEGQAREKNVRLVADLPEPAPPTVETDAAKLKQVLINLTGNALKFSEGGTVTVRLETGADGVPTAIAVEDTGIGIPPERLEAIFEAFAQADGSTSRRFGGTGLGLAISRSLCQLLGYDLEVASTVGEGSTFTIRMAGAPASGPVEPPPPVDPPPPAPRTPTEAPPPGEARARQVLVVDDEESDRTLLSHHLRQAGWTVTTASSGHEALDAAHRERPDVITLDLRMPDLDGEVVLRQLKNHPRTEGIPVVVVSVAAHEERTHLGRAHQWIQKPVDRDDLLRILAAAVGDAGADATSAPG